MMAYSDSNTRRWFSSSSRGGARLGFAGTLLMLLAGSSACDTRPSNGSTQPAPTNGCPAVECKCACPANAANPTVTTTPATRPATTAPAGTSESVREEVEELTYQLGRKLARKDASCAADLERVAEIAPRSHARMGFYRAQCLLVIGKCNEGADLMRKEWAETSGMSPETLERSVEMTVLTMCTGRLDDRGEMLRALTKLQEGAYTSNIGIRACTTAIKTIAKLKMKVKPKDDEDHQVLSIADTFPMSAASCLARAGDCKASWATFQEHYNGAYLAEIKDPAVRATTLRSTFDSVAAKCKDKV